MDMFTFLKTTAGDLTQYETDCAYWIEMNSNFRHRALCSTMNQYQIIVHQLNFCNFAYVMFQARPSKFASAIALSWYYVGLLVQVPLDCCNHH